MSELPAERLDETEGASSDASSVSVPPPVSDDEFRERVDRILALIEKDPAVRDRVLVELYVQVSEFATTFRAMQDDFGKLGPGGILKMLRGKG